MSFISLWLHHHYDNHKPMLTPVLTTLKACQICNSSLLTPSRLKPPSQSDGRPRPTSPAAPVLTPMPLWQLSSPPPLHFAAATATTPTTKPPRTSPCPRPSRRLPMSRARSTSPLPCSTAPPRVTRLCSLLSSSLRRSTCTPMCRTKAALTFV